MARHYIPLLRGSTMSLVFCAIRGIWRFRLQHGSLVQCLGAGLPCSLLSRAAARGEQVKSTNSFAIGRLYNDSAGIGQFAFGPVTEYSTVMSNPKQTQHLRYSPSSVSLVQEKRARERLSERGGREGGAGARLTAHGTATGSSVAHGEHSRNIRCETWQRGEDRRSPGDNRARSRDLSGARPTQRLIEGSCRRASR